MSEYVVNRTETIKFPAYWSQNGGAPTVSYSNFTYTLYREGRSVRDWRRRISNQMDASSDYTFRRREFSVRVPFRCYGTSPSGSATTDLWGDARLLPPTVATLLEATPELANKALGNLIQKMDQEVERVQALNFVHEFGQTKRMVFDRSNQLFESLNGMRGRLNRMYYMYRKLKGGFRRFVRDSSDIYLEWKFGAAPVMADIASAAREVNQGITHYNPVVRAHSMRDDFDHYTVTTGVSYADYKKSVAVYRQTKFSYVIGLRLALDVPERWGCSIGNIPGAIHEAAPWSWLADYFWDMQGFLAQFQVMRIPRVYFTKAVRRRAHHTITVANGSSTTRYALGKAYCQNLDYTRTSIAALPFYVPDLNLAGPFEGVRLWNVSAIAGQRYPRF